MSSTKKQPTSTDGGLLPASLADAQLDHFERIAQYVTRVNAENTFRGLDHEYWERRLGRLAETHDLVAVQRRRVFRLLDLLKGHASVSICNRTAA
ncbi:hypothetical protein [Paraburkholderia sp. MM5477-R1]|uniref:hypothetical protein n=1 Tax=Paraburkholderia sp. MM5477-R1 TaxID=2991062 RepID=UPI003D1FC82E